MPSFSFNPPAFQQLDQFFCGYRAGCLLGLVLLVATPRVGTAGDDDFEILFDGICQAGALPVDLFLACNAAFPAGSLAAEGGAGAFTTSSNFGTSGAQATVANNLEGQNRLDDDDELLFEIGNDGGGWGLLLAAQTGATDRKQTDLENGFDSSLSGFVLGLDYLFSESHLAGLTLSTTDDAADFDDDAGKLDTETDALLLYLTWLPSDRLSVDVYLGTADADFDGEREVLFGNINGRVENSTSSSQTLAGFSVSYQWNRGDFGTSAFIAYDINDTEIDGYTETGNTGLELVYPDQDVESKTTSLGLHLSYSKQFSWGLLLPNLRIAAVHESSDDARNIDTEVALARGPVLTIETDDPDRDYGLIGVGVIGALNNGQQWFVDYETRVSHDLIDDWSLSAGYLVEL